MNSKYKNLVFDVGGVLLSYRWEYAVADAGLTLEEAKRVCDNMFNDELWVELDLGNMPYADIIDEYCKKYPEDEYAIRFFLEHPENMPIDRPGVWEQIHRLKQEGYMIYILSNYSDYMFSVHTDGKPFWADVDGALVSYMVHMVKPNADIYEELLSRFDLDPEETIFFDDRKENVEGAINCGLGGFVVLSEDALVAELLNY